MHTMKPAPAARAVGGACVMIAVALLAGAAVLMSQGPEAVGGRVVIDADGDGQADAGEAGLPGVAVSNGRDVALSAADGRFTLPGRGTGVVFVSLPDGHEIDGHFWRPAAAEVSFALRRVPQPRAFTFFHASDPHVSAQSLPRFQEVARLATGQRPAFVLVSGDLVRDALRVGEAEARGYYDLYLQAIEAFPMRVWSVPGNHENFGIERHSSLVSARHPLYGKGMYRERLGPTYYSFTYGGVHFVGLDTVDIDDLWYYGHVDATQLAWLAADLATVPAGTPIVTFNHIPFVSASPSISGYTDEGAAPTLIKIGGRWQFRHTVSNLADVQAAIGGRPWPLALAGHVHLRESIHVASTSTTRFHQAAAVVGPTQGAVPATSGFTIYRVRDGVIDDGEFVPLAAAGPPRHE